VFFVLHSSKIEGHHSFHPAFKSFKSESYAGYKPEGDSEQLCAATHAPTRAQKPADFATLQRSPHTAQPQAAKQSKQSRTPLLSNSPTPLGNLAASPSRPSDIAAPNSSGDSAASVDGARARFSQIQKLHELPEAGSSMPSMGAHLNAFACPLGRHTGAGLGACLCEAPVPPVPPVQPVLSTGYEGQVDPIIAARSALQAHLSADDAWRQVAQERVKVRELEAEIAQLTRELKAAQTTRKVAPP
jgi:hypothetical protein